MMEPDNVDLGAVTSADSLMGMMDMAMEQPAVPAPAEPAPVKKKAKASEKEFVIEEDEGGLEPHWGPQGG
eukprot:SAG22_NODE_656_length_8099_cov_2.665500_5_plen_70_part_00